MNPSVLYITAAALSRLSLNPLALMDGPVKAFQDAGNRITASQILDQEEKEAETCSSWMNTDEEEASNSKSEEHL